MFDKVKKARSKSLVYSMFLSLIVVTTLTSLSSTLTGLVDTYCVQALNSTSAYSIASPLTQINYGLASLLAVGCQVIITKYLASGKQDKAKQVFMLGIIFAIIVSIILMMFGIFGNRFLASFLGANGLSAESFTRCSKYIKYYSMGLPFLFLNEFLMPMVYLDNDKKTATASIFVTIIINSTLDVVLSNYYKSISGVALACNAGLICSSLILLTHFFRKGSSFKFSFKNLSFKEAPSVLLAGSSTGIKNLVITARCFVLNYLYFAIANAWHFSSETIFVARGIEGSVSNLFCCGIGGLISTVITLGAIFYNEEDEKSLNELLNAILKFCIIIGGTLTLIYFFLAEPIARFYNVKPGEDLKQTVTAMRCESLTIMFSTFNTAMLAFFQGSKKHIWAYFCTFMQSFALQVMFVAVLGFTIGVKGIWIGTALGFIAYPLIHLTTAAIKSKHFPRGARDLFFLGKNFGYEKDKMMEFSVLSIVDTFDLVTKTLQFTENWNIDKVRRNYLAMCTEELANLVVLSGFSKDKNPHQLDVRILYKSETDTIMIRSRDNCQKFNVQKVNEKLNCPDRVSNISLRMIINSCKLIEYNRILKMNNFIIKF